MRNIILPAGLMVLLIGAALAQAVKSESSAKCPRAADQGAPCAEIAAPADDVKSALVSRLVARDWTVSSDTQFQLNLSRYGWNELDPEAAIMFGPPIASEAYRGTVQFAIVKNGTGSTVTASYNVTLTMQSGRQETHIRTADPEVHRQLASLLADIKRGLEIDHSRARK